VQRARITRGAREDSKGGQLDDGRVSPRRLRTLHGGQLAPWLLGATTIDAVCRRWLNRGHGFGLAGPARRVSQRVAWLAGSGSAAGCDKRVVLAAAAGARRTDSAYARLLAWGHASHLRIAPSYSSGSPDYYRALGRLPHVAAMSTGMLLNLAIPGRYQEAAQIGVYSSPDGRMGVSVDRVKVLAGRLFDPGDPRAIMISQKIADEQHVRPGGMHCPGFGRDSVSPAC
jgi:hypothetical protein